MRYRSLLASLAIAPAALVIGCGIEDPPKYDIVSTEQALSGPLDEMPLNGLPPDGIAPTSPLLPLLQTVWRHSLDNAGFALTLGAPVSPPISSLFITTTSAEPLMKEIVECALNSGEKVQATINQNTTFTWWGKFGLCDTDSPSPLGNWRTSFGGASLQCRQMVSACVLARINALNRHVPVSIRIPDKIGVQPIDARKFHPVKKVRVQTMLRNGAMAAIGWQPDFVGICTRNSMVTLQRTPAAMGHAVRVCTGIHACNPYQSEPIVEGSHYIYSGFLTESAAGSDPIRFTCPGDAATNPSGKPDQAYFSILVNRGTGEEPLPDPMLTVSDPTTIYPASERDVFTWLEGAFYGQLLPDSGYRTDNNACYSPLWKEGVIHDADRICATLDATRCFIKSGFCSWNCPGRSPGPDDAYYDCISDAVTPPWLDVTVFLNDPSALNDPSLINGDPASAIESLHDVCTPGAPVTNDTTSAVVTSVCAADPYCCNAAWDNRCVDEVQTIGGNHTCATSTAPCSHPVCTTGDRLSNGCSPVVTSVCGVDPFCCGTAWDSICKQEVQTVAHSQECNPP